MLTKRRPLRNSHIHVLGHARFPLRFAPLLGAPEGPRVPSTRLPAWVSEEFVPQGLRVGYRSGARTRATARARSKATATATVTAIATATATAGALASLHRSRPWPTTSNQKLASKTRQEAGSKENGVPCGAPRSGATCRGKRACSSTGTCELRSGLQGASTAGDPGCTTHPGRGSGVPSFLLLSGQAGEQKEVTRPKGRNAFASKKGHRRTAKIAGGARSDNSKAKSRRLRAEPASCPPASAITQLRGTRPNARRHRVAAIRAVAADARARPSIGQNLSVRG